VVPHLSHFILGLSYLSSDPIHFLSDSVSLCSNFLPYLIKQVKFKRKQLIEPILLCPDLPLDRNLMERLVLLIYELLIYLPTVDVFLMFQLGSVRVQIRCKHLVSCRSLSLDHFIPMGDKLTLKLHQICLVGLQRSLCER
jgi:hypothetical protein